LPFHNYAGPGTNVGSQLLNNKKPTTAIDAAALIHDIEYFRGDQAIADQTMFDNINQNVLLAPFANIAKLAFKVKDLFGYNVKTDEKAYQQLKNYAISNDFLSEYPQMQFTDDKKQMELIKDFVRKTSKL